jgi:hypothetical protein
VQDRRGQITHYHNPRSSVCVSPLINCFNLYVSIKNLKVSIVTTQKIRPDNTEFATPVAEAQACWSTLYSQAHNLYCNNMK